MRRLLACLALVVAALIVATPAAQAKSYRFPSVRIDATLRPDGSLEVVEERTFAFDGSFSGARWVLAWPGRLTRGVSVEEAGLRVDARVAGEERATTVSWGFTARDEERTWTIRYTALCATRVYEDAAHLNWRFLGRWGVPTDDVRITIHLPDVADAPFERPATCPSGASPDAGLESRPLRSGEARAWGHGPYAGEVAFSDPSTVVLTVPGVAGDQYVEGSVLLPPEAIPSAPAIGRDARAEILAFEAALADRSSEAREQQEDRRRRAEERAAAREAARLAALEAEAAQERAARRWDVGIALGLLALVPILVLVARRRDRDPTAPDVVHEPPDDTHPAELAMLWSAFRGEPAPANAYRAQLLHLAAEGVIELRAVGLVSEPTDLIAVLKATPAEGPDVEFVRFLFPAETAGEEVKLSGLSPAHGRGRRLEVWRDNVASKTIAGTARLRAGRSRAETAFAFVGFLVGCVVGVVTMFAGVSAALPPLAGAIAWVCVLRLVAPRLSEGDRQRFGRWIAFRRFLRDFSSLSEAPALAVVIWERYLAYAVALDVADEVERQVRALVPPEQVPAPWPGGPRGLDGLRWVGVVHQAVPRFASPVVAGGARSGGGLGRSMGGGGRPAHAGWAASGFGRASSRGGFGGGFSGGGRHGGMGGLGGRGGGTHGRAH